MAETKKSKKPEKPEKPKKSLKKPAKKVAPAEKVALPEKTVEAAEMVIEIKEEKKPAETEISRQPEKYYQAIGRRKTAIASLRLWTKGEKNVLVNEKPLEKYFQTFELQQTALAALLVMKCLDKFGVSAKVKGGGLQAQAEAFRHGTAKCLVSFNPDFRKRLKKAGFLLRDSRMRERKKFGLKRARKAPQWAKR